MSVFIGVGGGVFGPSLDSPLLLETLKVDVVKLFSF